MEQNIQIIMHEYVADFTATYSTEGANILTNK